MSYTTTNFDFYLGFAKPLVLHLSEPNDRALAAAWIQKLKDSKIAPEELRTEYLKLLLFVLQRKKLIGPFLENPNQLEKLEKLPATNFHDVAKELLELEEESRKQKIKKGIAGPSGDFPPYSIEYSADLLEYSAAQDIPNFGVHAYYAISNDPIPYWDRTENTAFAKINIIPKEEKSSPIVLPSPKKKDEKDKSVALEKSLHEASKDASILREPIPSPKKEASPVSQMPFVPPPEDKESEDREPPTWGSNLISVSEPPVHDADFTPSKSNLANLSLPFGGRTHPLSKTWPILKEKAKLDRSIARPNVQAAEAKSPIKLPTKSVLKSPDPKDFSFMGDISAISMEEPPSFLEMDSIPSIGSFELSNTIMEARRAQEAHRSQTPESRELEERAPSPQRRVISGSPPRELISYEEVPTLPEAIIQSEIPTRSGIPARTGSLLAIPRSRIPSTPGSLARSQTLSTIPSRTAISARSGIPSRTGIPRSGIPSRTGIPRPGATLATAPATRYSPVAERVDLHEPGSLYGESVPSSNLSNDFSWMPSRIQRDDLETSSFSIPYRTPSPRRQPTDSYLDTSEYSILHESPSPRRSQFSGLETSALTDEEDLIDKDIDEWDRKIAELEAQIEREEQEAGISPDSILDAIPFGSPVSEDIIAAANAHISELQAINPKSPKRDITSTPVTRKKTLHEVLQETANLSFEELERLMQDIESPETVPSARPSPPKISPTAHAKQMKKLDETVKAQSGELHSLGETPRRKTVKITTTTTQPQKKSFRELLQESGNLSFEEFEQLIKDNESPDVATSARPSPPRISPTVHAKQMKKLDESVTEQLRELSSLGETPRRKTVRMTTTMIQPQRKPFRQLLEDSANLSFEELENLVKDYESPEQLGTSARFSPSRISPTVHAEQMKLNESVNAQLSSLGATPSRRPVRLTTTPAQSRRRDLQEALEQSANLSFEQIERLVQELESVEPSTPARVSPPRISPRATAEQIRQLNKSVLAQFGQLTSMEPTPAKKTRLIPKRLFQTPSERPPPALPVVPPSMSDMQPGPSAASASTSRLPKSRLTRSRLPTSGLPRTRRPAPARSRTDQLAEEYEKYKKRYRFRHPDAPPTPPVFSRFRSLMPDANRVYDPSEFGETENIRWRPAETYVDAQNRWLTPFNESNEVERRMMVDLFEDDFNQLSPSERSPSSTLESTSKRIRDMDHDLLDLKISTPARAGLPVTTPSRSTCPKRQFKSVFQPERLSPMSRKFLELACETRPTDILESFQQEGIPEELRFSPPSEKVSSPEALEQGFSEIKNLPYLRKQMMQFQVGRTRGKRYNLMRKSFAPGLGVVHENTSFFPQNLLSENFNYGYADAEAAPPSLLDTSIPKEEELKPPLAPEALHWHNYPEWLTPPKKVKQKKDEREFLLLPPEGVTIQPIPNELKNILHLEAPPDEMRPFAKWVSPPPLSPTTKQKIVEELERTRPGILPTKLMFMKDYETAQPEDFALDIEEPPDEFNISLPITPEKLEVTPPHRESPPRRPITPESPMEDIHKLTFRLYGADLPDYDMIDVDERTLRTGKTRGKEVSLRRKHLPSKLSKILEPESLHDEYDFYRKITETPTALSRGKFYGKRTQKSPKVDIIHEHPMIPEDEDVIRKGYGVYPEDLIGDRYTYLGLDDSNEEVNLLDTDIPADVFQPVLKPSKKYQMEYPDWLSPPNPKVLERARRMKEEPTHLPFEYAHVEIEPQLRDIIHYEAPPAGVGPLYGDYSPPPLSPTTKNKIIKELQTTVPSLLPSQAMFLSDYRAGEPDEFTLDVEEAPFELNLDLDDFDTTPPDQMIPSPKEVTPATLGSPEESFAELAHRLQTSNYDNTDMMDEYSKRLLVGKTRARGHVVNRFNRPKKMTKIREGEDIAEHFDFLHKVESAQHVMEPDKWKERTYKSPTVDILHEYPLHVQDEPIFRHLYNPQELLGVEEDVFYDSEGTDAPQSVYHDRNRNQYESLLDMPIGSDIPMIWNVYKPEAAPTAKRPLVLPEWLSPPNERVLERMRQKTDETIVFPEDSEEYTIEPELRDILHLEAPPAGLGPFAQWANYSPPPLSPPVYAPPKKHPFQTITSPPRRSPPFKTITSPPRRQRPQTSTMISPPRRTPKFDLIYSPQSPEEEFGTPNASPTPPLRTPIRSPRRSSPLPMFNRPSPKSPDESDDSEYFEFPTNIPFENTRTMRIEDTSDIEDLDRSYLEDELSGFRWLD